MSVAKRIPVVVEPSDHIGTIYEHIEYGGIYQVVFKLEEAA